MNKKLRLYLIPVILPIALIQAEDKPKRHATFPQCKLEGKKTQVQIPR